MIEIIVLLKEEWIWATPFVKLSFAFFLRLAFLSLDLDYPPYIVAFVLFATVFLGPLQVLALVFVR